MTPSLPPVSMASKMKEGVRLFLAQRIHQQRSLMTVPYGPALIRVVS